jgi:3-oxoacyl-[acyl-carrier protein] reductase
MSRTVLISGASKGSGRALSERLAKQGHTVVGFARAGDATFPGELHTVDLADRNATSAALQDISAMHRIDAVVNNVGLVRPQALEEVTLDALDAVLDVNLRTAVQLTQAALPAMREQGWGRVVNIASGVALGAPQRTAYAAAKAGLVSCTRGWGSRKASCLEKVWLAPKRTFLVVFCNYKSCLRQAMKRGQSDVDEHGA